MTAPDDLEHLVEFTALDRRGRGRARLPDGRAVRVRGVDAGERARVRLTTPAAAGRAVDAELVELVEPSPHRVAPRCAQIGHCPGCTVRHLSLDRQRAWQLDVHRERLADALARSPHAPSPHTVPWRALPGAPPDGGRSRAVARALLDANGQLVLGLGRRGDPPVQLGRCPVQTAPVQAIITSLERDLRALDMRPYDPQTRRPGLRHAIVQAIGASARVILGFTGPFDAQAIADVLPDHPTVSVLADALPYRGAGLMSRPLPVRGDPALTFELDGDRFRASPRAWIPQAPDTVPTVRQAVVDQLCSDPTDVVLEIGCGIGILSLPVARRCSALRGIDIERAATLDATHNAAHNGVSNARFEPGDAPRALRRLLKRSHRFDRAVVHAMRPPYGPVAMSALAALRPRRIVYLAPDVRSLAEDLEALPGYVVDRVATVDQTPGTLPLLTICALTRVPS